MNPYRELGICDISIVKKIRIMYNIERYDIKGEIYASDIL